MYDKEGLINYLNARLDRAISYRRSIGIDDRLRKADEIMFHKGRSCSERDMNQNFLRRKIFSLYTILSNQIESQRQQAIGLEITDQEDAPIELYESVADELIDELMHQKNIVPDGYASSVNSFLKAIEYYYNIRVERMKREIIGTLSSAEPILRKALFSNDNREELRKILFDYVMYPSAFAVGVYSEKAFDTDFIRGRVVRNERTRIGFRRVSPWRVYPVASRKSISSGGDVFIVEDFTIENLYSMMGNKNYIDEGVENIIDSIESNDSNKGHCKWFNARVLGDESNNGSEHHYLKDDQHIARGVMYDGHIPKKYFEEGGTGYEVAQVWFVDQDIFYVREDDGKRSSSVMDVSFRPGKYGSWGLGPVDICYEIQKTIDFVGSKIIGNLEKTSDFQGLLDRSVAKSMIKDKKSSDGTLDIDLSGINIADLPRGNANPFYRFQVANTQQSGILLINELKRHIAELLSLPDFIDGSTNVGTVGRTSGGLFLLQRNLSEGVELVRKEYVRKIIVPIARAILDKMRDEGKLSKVILNYDVVVRDFGLQEERSESADETLKKVQALTQLNSLLQQQGVPVQDNEVLNDLHDSIIKDIAPNYYEENAQGLRQLQQQDQQPTQEAIQQNIE